MRRKAKWIFTIIAIIVFIILGSTVPDDDLKSRAMAVGLGIDCDDEGNIIACAQILTSSETEGKPAGTRVVETEAKLLSSAISKITEICGMTLTVTHCNVILLGEKLINSGDACKQIFTLLENTYISDNAYVFACEGTPMEVLSSKSAFGTNASQYLQQLISSYGTYDNISYKMLRQIIVDYHNLGETTYMPFIKKVPVTPKVPSSSEGSESSGSNAAPAGEAEDYSYNLNNVVVLKRGELIGRYGEDASKAINYILTKVDKGSDDFEIEKGVVGVFVLSNDVKKEYDIDSKTFSVNVKIGATVKDFKAKDEADMEETFAYGLTEDELKTCAEDVRRRIEEFFAEMQEADADVFEVRQSFYSQYGKRAKNIELKDVKFRLEVVISLEK